MSMVNLGTTTTGTGPTVKVILGKVGPCSVIVRPDVVFACATAWIAPVREPLKVKEAVGARPGLHDPPSSTFP